MSFTQNTIIVAKQDIHIGNEVLIAEFTSIQHADHGVRNIMVIKSLPLVAKQVYVVNDVWIGCHVTILKGVSIGDGAIIGANAMRLSNCDVKNLLQR
jgi:acetyltransferase-like isoleucine patch superfamily enzyme